MANYQWNTAGSYYFGLFPGPTGPPNEQFPTTEEQISSSSVGATVEDNSTAPQIDAGTPYTQPATAAPQENAEVDASSSLAEAGPNQIDVTGENYTQANTSAPAANPQVTVGGFVNGNPLGL